MLKRLGLGTTRLAALGSPPDSGGEFLRVPNLFTPSDRAYSCPVAFGDIAKVSGAPIGCLVRRQGGEAALDCRRAGDLTGSYGTILTKTQVLVVRFESPKVAKIVFQARHRQLRAHTCGG